MGRMRDLFGDTPYDPDQGAARHTDPSTSHEAAAHLDVTALQRRVYQVLATYGPPRGEAMCVVEIHARLPELSIDTISPRMKPMVDAGLIRCLGKRPRANRYGNIRNQLVYEIHPS